MYEYRVIEIGPARRQERHALNPNGPDVEAILNEHAAEGFRLVQVLASGDRPHMAAQMLVLEREVAQGFVIRDGSAAGDTSATDATWGTVYGGSHADVS